MSKENSSTGSLKTQAKALRTYLAEQDIEINHSKSLEAVARSHGFKDWNTASANAGVDVERQKEKARRLEAVTEFQERLASEMACEVTVDFIKRQKAVTYQQMQVTVSATAGEDHPHSVDETVRKVAGETSFGKEFHLIGWGGGVSGWARDNTFWEGPQPPREEVGKYTCKCGHYLAPWIGDQYWCSACGIAATVEDGEIKSWSLPNPKMKGMSRAQEIEEEKQLLEGIPIFVNGRSMKWNQSEISYGDVVRLAHPKLQGSIEGFTVTYRGSEIQGSMWAAMAVGIPVEPGMVFNAMNTSNA